MSNRLMRLAIAIMCLVIGASETRASTAMKVAASQHTCVLTAAGEVFCWGWNSSGQLGDGTTTNRLTPTLVPGLGAGAVAIEVGYQHTCAVTKGGGVVCWGLNSSGQLGDGTATNRLTPTAVSGLGSGVAAIGLAGLHSCALTSGGAVFCWGDNWFGQLGDGTTTSRLTPTAVLGLQDGVAAIAAGGGGTCAVTIAGSALCWGWNKYGQLGDGSTTDHWTPTGVLGLQSNVKAVTRGYTHTCALTTDGVVMCWGENNVGQLGDGTTTNRLTAAAVVGLASGVRQIESEDHTCAITATGAVMCWGCNYRYRIGDGTEINRTLPIQVPGEASGMAAVSPGWYHTCAVTTGGGVMCAGYNDVGQIGDGTTTTRPTPVRLDGFGHAAASDQTGDLKSDLLWRHAARGEVWLWPMDGGHHTAESYVGAVGDVGWEIRGLGDQTGDGQADLLWRHVTTGQLYLWTMNGSTVEAETYVGTADPAFDIVGTGDYDGDGKSDILWRHQTTGELWLWRMGGATTLSVTYVDAVELAYGVQGSGDLNGDGRADLVWQGAAGDVWVWLMNGATKQSETWIGTVPDSGYQIQAVADFTGDGKADLLWWHATRGEMWLWEMNGVAKVSEAYVGTVPDVNYRIVGTGDYDGDGQADILWHHLTRGEVWVWLMDGTTKVSEAWVATVPDTGYQIVKGK